MGLPEVVWYRWEAIYFTANNNNINIFTVEPDYFDQSESKSEKGPLAYEMEKQNVSVNAHVYWQEMESLWVLLKSGADWSGDWSLDWLMV